MIPASRTRGSVAARMPVALLLAFAVGGVQAATFCANSYASLQNALTNSASNGQNDNILIEAVTIQLPAQTRLSYFSGQNSNLVLIGGYAPGCNGQLDGARTVIDGGDAAPLAQFNLGNGNLILTDIDWRNGRGTTLNQPIDISVQGELTIERNGFFDNRCNADGVLHTIALASSGRLRLRNSLFVRTLCVTGNPANTNARPIRLVANGSESFFITGNTFVETIADANNAIHMQGMAGQTWYIGNNIFWDNIAAFPLFLPPLRELRNNDFQYMPILLPGDSGNVSVEPGFIDADADNYMLSPSSPLVNAGALDAAGGLGAIAYCGGPRVAQGIVDIGACEMNDRIFAHGFE